MRFRIEKGVRTIGATVFGAVLLLLAACDSPEERKATHYKRGQELLAKGEVIKAAVEFKNVLQIDEDHVGALYGLSKFQMREQNWAALAGVLRKVIDLDPAHVDARIDYCRLMLLGDAVDKAIKFCGEAEKLDGANTNIFALQAAIHYKLQDYSPAMKLANKALQLDSTNIDALIVLAARHLAEGNPKAALEKLDRGLEIDNRNVGLSIFKITVLERLKDVAGTESVFRQLIKLYPDNRSFRLAFVRYYLSKDRKDAAEAEIRAHAKANPSNVAAALDVVKILKTVKGNSAAEAELRSLAASKPGVYQYKLELASLLETLDKKEEARRLTQNVIDTGGKDAISPARIQMVGMLLRDKKLPEAEALIDVVLEEDSRHIDALVMRAEILSKRGAYNDAIADLRTALNEAPRAARILLPLARLLELTGSIDLAKEHLASAAQSSGFRPVAGLTYVRFLLRHGERGPAEDILNRVVRGTPNDVAALTLLATLRLNRRDWEGAQRIADQMSKLQNNKGLSQQILGTVLRGQKKFSESISILREAQSESPAAIRPIISLVTAYVSAGKQNEALEFLEGLARNDPKRADVHVLIGSLLIQQGKVEEARARYALAIKNSPDSPRGYRALAVLLVREENTEGALKVLKDGLERRPDDFVLNLISANIKEIKGDAKGAIAIYEHMHKARPESLIIINNLASLLAEHRTDIASLDRAYNLARRLRGKQVPQFKDTLAWVQFKRGERNEAISLLREATKSATPLPIYFYHLGVVYEADGLIELARESFTEALKLAEKRPFPLADQTRTALENLKDKGKAPAN